jgi:beta-glucanase (GH16 family)
MSRLPLTVSSPEDTSLETSIQARRKGRWQWLLVAVLLSLSTAANTCLANNLLSNPGFEFDNAQSTNLAGWLAYGGNAYSETSAAQAHSGSNYFKVYQDFNGAVNYTGIYQDYISGQGAAYAADGWAFTLPSDTLAGQNVAWIEVSFRDASANVLALYRSAQITTNSALSSWTFPINKWVDLPVTNQFNPGTLAPLTNKVTQLIAPAGTYFVRYQIVLQGDAKNDNGSVYFDDLNLVQTGGAPYGNWNIVWSDEFNGTTINPEVWTYDTGNGGWGNNELEYYTSRTNNSYEAGGYLHIVAQKESYGGADYTSARLKTESLFSWPYGRFEWRAQLPGGAGFWPALWMMGTNITSINWPACGEIDVVENNGSVLNVEQGSLHSGSDETGYYNFLNGDSVTNFHTYTLDRATNAILYYVDGHLYETQTGWGTTTTNAYPFPFNQPFFLIMNIAVGGNYLGNPSTNTINTGSFPGIMNVDYVRIYNQTSPLQISLTLTNNSLVATWPSNVISHLQAQYTSPTGGLGTNWLNLNFTSSPVKLNLLNTNAFFRVSSP